MGTMNLYLFKAIQAYPWELEKSVEALNYALSYEPENAKALSLMGKVYAEQLGDYETAKEYFEKALVSNLEMSDIYPDYIRVLLSNEDFEEAQKVIDFAKNLKGIDKATIKLLQACLFEAISDFKKAEQTLKESAHLALNNDFIEFVDAEIARVAKKRRNQHQFEKEKIEKEQVEAEAKKKDENWFLNRLNSLL
ncbi:tetratricopeptide repeat protein [Planktosalinus lacus]|uniref:Tetratricopeptide repeat protein n=1 Tax=Planktosalinus lacus TaxID=1526573 RepID=A0A8J2VA31_9FLAO|nr:tetratricopeptide repeat protein [Planktosalinus lacus]GGD95552.1 hypothetical protein GCM10011312_19040 [Planktosalinus lacus]